MAIEGFAAVERLRGKRKETIEDVGRLFELGNIDVFFGGMRMLDQTWSPDHARAELLQI